MSCPTCGGTRYIMAMCGEARSTLCPVCGKAWEAELAQKQGEGIAGRPEKINATLLDGNTSTRRISDAVYALARPRFDRYGNRLPTVAEVGRHERRLRLSDDHEHSTLADRVADLKRAVTAVLAEVTDKATRNRLVSAECQLLQAQMLLQHGRPRPSIAEFPTL